MPALSNEELRRDRTKGDFSLNKGSEGELSRDGRKGETGSRLNSGQLSRVEIDSEGKKPSARINPETLEAARHFDASGGGITPDAKAAMVNQMLQKGEMPKGPDGKPLPPYDVMNALLN